MGRHVANRHTIFSRISLSFCFLMLVLAPVGAATTTIQGAQGLVVSVEANGTYDIFVPNPGWHFGGTIGHTLSNVTVATGLDGVGSYSEIAFDFTATVGRHAAIRTYANQTSVVFTLSCPNATTSF